MTRKRFLLVLGWLPVLALATWSGDAPSLDFIQLTDTHVSDLAGVEPKLAAAREHFSPSGKALAAFFADARRGFRPAFFLFTGDLIDAYSFAGAQGREIYGQVEAFSRVVAGSPVPVYLALGNHDIARYAGIENGKLDADQSVAGEARAAWVAAAPCFRRGTWYSFEKQVGRTTYLFLMLDNGYGQSIAQEQLQWLARAARGAGDRVMILAMHIPLGEDARARSIKAALGPALPTLVLAGHLHSDNIAPVAFESGAAVQVRTAAFGYGANNWRRVRLLEDAIEVYATGTADKLETTIRVRAAHSRATPLPSPVSR